MSQVCAAQGVSRKTFYKWVHRFREDGLDGLVDRSTRPHRSPGQIGVEVEDEIVRLRKELADAGLDHGATTIQWHLGRKPVTGGRVPSVAGVHRVLVRRGLVVAQPAKRPKSSWKRFEAAAPNERWQIDAMDWVTAAGVVRVFNIIDDHSRVAIRSGGPRGDHRCCVGHVPQGAAMWGMPPGSCPITGCFSATPRRFEVPSSDRSRDARITPRPPGKSNVSNRPSRNGSALRTSRSTSIAATQLDEFTTSTPPPPQASAGPSRSNADPAPPPPPAPAPRLQRAPLRQSSHQRRRVSANRYPSTSGDRA